MNKKSLLLTYCFPPFPGPESYLAAKLFSNMPNSDFDIVTIKPVKTWMSEEVELAQYVSKRILQINSVTSPRWFRCIPLAKRDIVKLNSSTRRLSITQLLWKISHFGALIFKQPDPFRVFNHIVYQKTKAHISEYDNLLTWSQYHSTSLVGLRIKEKMGKDIKWAAYFGDPWHLNPYVPLKGIAKKLNLRLQDKVFESADFLLFPTKEMANFATKGYGNGITAKCRILPHTFDPNLYPTHVSSNAPKDTVLFKYIGQFYGARKPEIILQGILTLLKRRPDLAKILKVEFVGSNIPHNTPIELVDDLPKGLLVYKQQVRYIESLKEMLSADCLISLDAPASNNIFMSGKLSDYIGAKKPLVAITNEGTTANLVLSYGGWVANPEKSEEVADALEKAIAHVRGNRGADFGDSEIRAEMSADRVARLLLDILSSPSN